MKIVMITGSAHKRGTTAAMAEAFLKGAAEAGHEVFRFDAAFRKVHPCMGCEHCHRTEEGCVYKDDMEALNPQLLAADGVVLVSPIYYYDMTAQLKAVLDRFYANDAALHKNKRVAWLTAMADDTADSAEGANATFLRIAKFLEWDVAGQVNAAGCWTAEDLQASDYAEAAYELGRRM